MHCGRSSDSFSAIMFEASECGTAGNSSPQKLPRSGDVGNGLRFFFSLDDGTKP